MASAARIPISRIGQPTVDSGTVSSRLIGMSL
jgi:hypothetical protein